MFERPAEPDIDTEYLIIGSGPAGAALGKKLAEAGRTVWVLGSPYDTQLSKAGVLTNTDLPAGTVGLAHIEEMVEEMVAAGVKTKTSLVVKLYRDKRLVIETKRQKFFADKIIIATGAKQVRLGFNGEEKFFHKGISDCSVCDYPLYRNKVVGVVGKHEYTSRAANFLVDHVSEVHLFWTDNEIPKIDERVKVYLTKSITALGGETISEVIITDYDGNSKHVSLHGLFVEGKPVPATKFLADSEVNLDENGYVKIDSTFNTSMGNVFAVGDVTGKTKKLSEVIVAVENLYSILIA